MNLDLTSSQKLWVRHIASIYHTFTVYTTQRTCDMLMPHIFHTCYWQGWQKVVKSEEASRSEA